MQPFVSNWHDSGSLEAGVDMLRTWRLTRKHADVKASNLVFQQCINMQATRVETGAEQVNQYAKKPVSA